MDIDYNVGSVNAVLEMTQQEELATVKTRNVNQYVYCNQMQHQYS